uniref:Uncharacterized protein n=1 Tax=Megaselia scalaris TaxID=36166 RepID=T1GTF4_MEGSC
MQVTLSTQCEKVRTPSEAIDKILAIEKAVDLKNQMGGGLDITMNCTSSTNTLTWLKSSDENV